MLIAVAEPRRGGLDQHLVGTGRGHLYLFDLQSTGYGMKDRSAHAPASHTSRVSCLSYVATLSA